MKRTKVFVAIAVVAMSLTAVFAFKGHEQKVFANITQIYDASGNLVLTAPTGNTHWSNTSTGGYTQAVISYNSGLNTVTLYADAFQTNVAYYK